MDARLVPHAIGVQATDLALLMAMVAVAISAVFSQFTKRANGHGGPVVPSGAPESRVPAAQRPPAAVPPAAPP